MEVKIVILGEDALRAQVEALTPVQLLALKRSWLALFTGPRPMPEMLPEGAALSLHDPAPVRFDCSYWWRPAECVAGPNDGPCRSCRWTLED